MAHSVLLALLGKREKQQVEVGHEPHSELAKILKTLEETLGSLAILKFLWLLTLGINIRRTAFEVLILGSLDGSFNFAS